jgi:hypothetical protein
LAGTPSGEIINENDDSNCDDNHNKNKMLLHLEDSGLSTSSRRGLRSALSVKRKRALFIKTAHVCIVYRAFTCGHEGRLDDRGDAQALLVPVPASRCGVKIDPELGANCHA